MPLSEPSRRPPNPYVMPRGRKPARGRRVAIVRGQDKSRWTDAYHAVLIAPWSVFFLGVTLYFVIVNALFAGLYAEVADWVTGWVPAISKQDADAIGRIGVNALLGKRATSALLVGPDADIADEAYVAAWTAMLASRIDGLRD